jgi:RHS repeat-associated protein
VKNLYNGNISETLWRSSKDNILRSYGYTYDDLNRLRNAQYIRPVNPLLSNTNLNPIVNTFNESMQYDKNGNIVALQRNGGMESQSPALPIDNLIYQYDGNRLLKVDDSASITDGFKDGINASTEYTYDLNGNMTTDQNKGVSSITYNHLNLPTKIVMSSGTITYVYNALGQKVSKTVSNSTISPATTSNTQYFGGFQYNNSILQFFPTAEGYVKNTVVSGANTYDYIFNYTDHLGNIRLSYGIAPGTQLLTIFEENNYYPFGLKHGNYNNQLKSIVNLKDVAFLDTPLDVKAAKAIPIDPNAPSSNSTVANSGYQYKYNGKELQDELGLNLYDYGARLYDPAAPHFLQIDPKAETSRRFSPYTYCLNNPVFFIDPDGMQAIENDDWIVHQDSQGKTAVTYDAEIKTKEQAEAKGYQGVSDVFKSASITGTSPEGGNYSYNLNEGGTVTDVGAGGTSIETGFTTPQGTNVGENKSALAQLAPVFQNSGDAAVVVGTILVCTGVGAPLGAGLITYGGYASLAGTAMELTDDANTGTLTPEKVATKVAMELIPAGAGAGFKSLGAPAAGEVFNAATVGADRLLDEMRDAKAGPYRE